MRSLSIQVQPDRVPELDIEAVQLLFEKLEGHPLVEKSAFSAGTDKGRYLNYTYGTNNAESLWDVIQKKIYGHDLLGRQLLRCSMAMCSSEEGWDDYVLLHHFDPQVPLQNFK